MNALFISLLVVASIATTSSQNIESQATVEADVSANVTINAESLVDVEVSANAAVGVSQGRMNDVSLCLQGSMPLPNYYKQLSVPDFEDTPILLAFVPETASTPGIDNICYTISPLPDNNNTFIQTISVVYCDGYNVVETTIFSQPQPGMYKGATPYCTWLDINIDRVVNESISCDVLLSVRTILSGDCLDLHEISIFGLSLNGQPMPESCLDQVNQAITRNGFPQQTNILFPSNLPNKCIYEQTKCVPFANRINDLFTGGYKPKISHCR